MLAHTTYTIYWAPSTPSLNGQAGTTFTSFPAGYESTVNGFLTNVADDGKNHKLSNAYSVDLQYGEPGGGVYESTFGTTFKDETLYPPRNTVGPTEDCPTSSNSGADGLPLSTQPCLTDEQIKNELVAFVTTHSLPTGLGAMYFVLTPQGVASCAGGLGAEAECSTNVFCAYHFQTGTPVLIYANMPYDHVPGCKTPAEPNGTAADDEINTLSHEHNEAVTDPEGEGWYYGNFVEVADKCTYPFFNPSEDGNEITDAYGPLLNGSSGATGYNQIINGGHYLLQREWSNAAGGCVTQAPVPTASFKIYANPATVGTPISFNAADSSTPAGALTSYQWEFEGGQKASGSEVTHTYENTGQHTVTLTVTNDSGASASSIQAVTVNESSSAAQTTTVTAPAPSPAVVTTTVTAPAPPTPAPHAFSASQVAGLIGLPSNGEIRSGLGVIQLGHAECPPACEVTVRLYAKLGTVKHGHRGISKVLIGTLTMSATAKGASAVALSLNGTGKRLLRKRHKLVTVLNVTVAGQEGGSWQIARTFTLTNRR